MGRMHYPAPLETGEAYDKIADWFMAGMSASPCGMPFLEELAGILLSDLLYVLADPRIDFESRV